jgi:hypothetical protein
VLLKIFCHYLDASPRFWPILGHICRRWRRLVFAYFRLYFTHGAPVLKTLDRRPTLPIVVQYGGSSTLDAPAPEDEDNIMAALKQSDRVSSISLTVTSSLLEKLSAIERPFSELEDLVLLSRDSEGLTLPSAFGWGTRLRSLRLTRIAFFTLPLLLYHSKKLVDLQLHEVLNPWLFSPEALTDALSGMAQLRSLSLHFLPTTEHIDMSRPYRKHVALPALTHLTFRGITTYLEGLVAGIVAPRLRDIEVTFFNESLTDLSIFGEFIDRIEMHKAYRQVHVQFSERAVAISLIQPGAPADTCLKLQIFCKSFSRQLCSMAHMCGQISAVLFSAEDLRIDVTRPSSGQADSDIKQWQALILHFRSTKCLYVAGIGDHATNVVHAVQLSKTRETVLPALHKLRIREPGPRHAPLRQAVVSLMASRWPSGRPIVEYERLWINEIIGGTGLPYAQRQRHTLTCFEQDMFLSTSRLRCSRAISF